MESIENIIVSLLNKIYGNQRFNKLPDSDLNLFGYEIALVARELLYVVMEIEKTFSFKFSEEDFIDPDFYTVKGFIKKAQSHLS
ncbi:hypothetical protein ACUZ9P_02135 [Desulfovibrio sp. QI0430]